jgi:phospholipase C
MIVRRAAAAVLAAAFSFSLGACSKSHSSSTTPSTAAAGSIQSLVSQKVKHVFVIVQENHTFDNYFGLYPGTAGQTVENLGSSTAQAIDCVPDPYAGAGACQRPFLISANTASPNHVIDAPDIYGGNNGRDGQLAAIDGGKMDGFLSENETGTNTVAAHNQALSIMTTYDCDTVPYLWYYAQNFTLFDHYFQANIGPSTPGNIQLFAAQIGQTEAAAGKGMPAMPTTPGNYSDGVPISGDNNPPDTNLNWRGSYAAQASPDNATYQSYATMPVLLNPVEDAAAVASGISSFIPDDLALEAKSGRSSIPWAWYEEGINYPADGTSSKTWNEHHTAPLYFDYINNGNSPFGTQTTLRDNTPGVGLLADIQNGTLPSSGVFWVKGGTTASPFPFKPADPVLANAGLFTGDDDHPGSGDSDHQVSEAYLATLINSIAKSKYWADSVIIVTWDDSGGMYDHLPPTSYGKTCPEDTTGTFAGAACGEGVRLPMLIISPFAKSGAVVNDASDAGSVSKFIETVFSLPTLASLPDEAAGVAAGLAPEDANSAISDLTGALDINKLNGSAAPISAATATIPNPSSPPTMNCASLGITPLASPATVPAGFLTAGAYSNITLTGTASVRRIAPPKPINDDDD